MYRQPKRNLHFINYQRNEKINSNLFKTKLKYWLLAKPYYSLKRVLKKLTKL